MGSTGFCDSLRSRSQVITCHFKCAFNKKFGMSLVTKKDKLLIQRDLNVYSLTIEFT